MKLQKMNIFHQFKQDLTNIIKVLFSQSADINFSIELPKDSKHGDIATNAAMVMVKNIGNIESLSSKDIALKIIKEINELAYIEKAAVAGPGFINITLYKEALFTSLHQINQKSEDYLKINLGKSEKINIEYVSANPTGPMHIGHARCAVYGDVLASLLEYCGFDVTKEFYVNDYGKQINVLAETVYLRYQEIITRTKLEIPSGLYPGEYVIPLAKKIVEQYGQKLIHMDYEEYIGIIKPLAVDYMLELIRLDLKNIGISHDVFFHESTLHKTNAIEKIVDQLKDKGSVYVGTLSHPKGIQEQEDWSPSEQLLFNTTKFGDDQDRPLQKTDGSWSYYAADLAYAQNKISRGFNQAVMVLGADHIGYVKRLQAIFSSLSDACKLTVKICQLVNFVENGVPIKMSKRAGNFTSVADVVNEVDKDIIRFIMLTKKNDVGIDFDLVKVKELSKDNPVFYVQYAYVRCFSLIEKLKTISSKTFDVIEKNEADYSLLTLEKELELIKKLIFWPKILESAVVNMEPHRIALFLHECVTIFHSLWSSYTRNNESYRFIIENDLDLTAARISLAKSITIIIEAAFKIMKITPLTKM